MAQVHHLRSPGPPHFGDPDVQLPASGRGHSVKKVRTEADSDGLTGPSEAWTGQVTAFRKFPSVPTRVDPECHHVGAQLARHFWAMPTRGQMSFLSLIRSAEPRDLTVHAEDVLADEVTRTTLRQW